MKTKTASIILALCLSASAQAQDFFDKADDFFKKNVSNGLVDYAALKKTPAPLDEMIAMVAAFKPDAAKSDKNKAFYINAYNLITIKAIASRMPIKKPTEVEGFFDKITYQIAGEKLTLNDIENVKIRPIYKDARTHFALVCGAMGCPKLGSFAYKPATLQAQLETQTKTALNLPAFIKVNQSGKKIEVSEIFKWYEADFLAESKTVLDYINRYLAKPATGFQLSYYVYDWNINKK